jgi:hypothetical protein
LSADEEIKKDIWIYEPASDLEKINFKQKEKKRKDHFETVLRIRAIAATSTRRK